MNNSTEYAQNKMYQVSTLQALAMGYTRAVVTVEELLEHGSVGLGTFEGVDGEMIVAGGKCYRATETGDVLPAPPDMGVPFAAVAAVRDSVFFSVGKTADIDELKTLMTLKVEEGFGLNSMHVVQIDGTYAKICARSESGYKSQHVELKELLSDRQKDFVFEETEGTLVCVYFPDFMDGINATGWHVHYISKDRSVGGHVFDVEVTEGKAQLTKISNIEIRMPEDPSFDTYSLKEASESDIKQIEQGSR